MGFCRGHASGGNHQTGKKIHFDLEKKANGFRTLYFQGSIVWLGNTRFLQLGAGHQQNITSETTLSSKIQYSDKEDSSINLKIRTHDHLEIAFGLLVPVLGSIWTRICTHDTM